MTTVFLSLLLSVLAVAALGISVALAAKKQADIQERIKASTSATPTNSRNESRDLSLIHIWREPCSQALSVQVLPKSVPVSYGSLWSRRRICFKQ